MDKSPSIFITGGTGYLGHALIVELLQRGYAVTALVRSGSEQKVPPGCSIVVGDALLGNSYRAHLSSRSTFIQLVGVSHPGPLKASQFRSVDQVAGQEAVRVAQETGVAHFIYLSVAQPAPVMRAYVAARAEVERRIRESGLSATILRPWYVVGTGHRWPVLLKPAYWLAERFAATRESAERLGLVTLGQMTQAFIRAVESSPSGIRIWTVSDIRRRG